MKKKFEKKLNLNKTTVVNLENQEMNNANGGVQILTLQQGNSCPCIITTTQLRSVCDPCLATLPKSLCSPCITLTIVSICKPCIF
ncbi:MAG: hypothetical protein GY765_06230 [bacterium]|nr:hypothetical protein [bacterium]